MAPKSDKEIIDILKKMPKPPDYPKDLQEARRVTVVAESRRMKPDGGGDNDSCLKKLFSFLLLVITFGSMFSHILS